MAELRVWLRLVGSLFVRHAAETVSVAMRREDEYWMVVVHFDFSA